MVVMVVVVVVVVMVVVMVVVVMLDANIVPSANSCPDQYCLHWMAQVKVEVG